MVRDESRDLPDDLRTTAEQLFSGQCKCDLSVGHICESCLIYSLMVRAAAEIDQLREARKKPMSDEELRKLPVAEFTGASFVGRNLYIISKIPGLYRIKCHKDKESTPTVSALRGSKRGRGTGLTLFVRDLEFENRIRLAILKGGRTENES